MSQSRRNRNNGNDPIHLAIPNKFIRTQCIEMANNGVVYKSQNTGRALRENIENDIPEI